MTQTIQIGQINTLLIDRITPPGIFLVDLSGNAVLLPNRYVQENMKIYDHLDVFVYTDSEDRPVATTQFPKILAGEFGVFEVKDVTKFGAFVDIGLLKDILVPKNWQKTTFKIGDKKILKLLLDERSNRLVCDERIERNFEKHESQLQIGQKVDLIVYAKTPLGYKVIVEKKYEALLFSNEAFGKIKATDELTGWIKNIREDGKIDVSLQPIGSAKRQNASDKILELLSVENELSFTYKSDAEDIAKVFGVSKKSFKSALTELLESNRIELLPNSIKLK